MCSMNSSRSPAPPHGYRKDIIVVDPTTAGVSLPNAGVDLNVAASARSPPSPIRARSQEIRSVAPPPSGIAAADICLFSASGLDTSMAYTVMVLATWR